MLRIADDPRLKRRLRRRHGRPLLRMSSIGRKRPLTCAAGHRRHRRRRRTRSQPSSARRVAELGKVVGTVYTDDLLDRIFRTFCIGK